MVEWINLEWMSVVSFYPIFFVDGLPTTTVVFFSCSQVSHWKGTLNKHHQEYTHVWVYYINTHVVMYIYTFLPLRGALQKWNHQPVEAIHAIGSITCCNHWAGRFNPHSLSLVVKANPIFIAKTVAVNSCWPNNQPFWNMVWSVIPLMNGKSSSVYFLIGLPHPFFRWLFHEINQPAIGVPPFMENPKCQWW